MSARRARAGVALAAVVLAVAARPATAQWPEARGSYWAKASVFHHRTSEQFLFDGTTRAFFQPNARSVSTALFLDVLYGVSDRLDVWAQVPYFDLRFDDDTQRLHDTGLSDVRVSARYHVASLRGGSVPVSVRLTAKIPVVDFAIDRDVIPVSEGQWDYEAWLETGVSLWPLPAYGVVWLGYRVRTRNPVTTVDPGDERALLAEVGSSVVGPLGVKVVLDGVFGAPTTIQGVGGPNDKREIVYLQPGVTVGLPGGFTLETGPRLPLRGRNYPAGRQWVWALFHRRQTP